MSKAVLMDYSVAPHDTTTNNLNVARHYNRMCPAFRETNAQKVNTMSAKSEPTCGLYR